MIRSGNPVLSGFEQPQRWEDVQSSDGVHLDKPVKVMTVGGTVNASAILLGLCSATAVGAWPFLTAAANDGNVGLAFGATIGGSISALVLMLVMMFAKKAAPFIAPIYAIAQGVFLTGASIFIAARFLGTDTETGSIVNPDTVGLIFQALLLTFGVFAGLLVAYKAGLVRIGGTMAKIVAGLFGAVLLYSIALFVGNGLFGAGIPNLYTSATPLGIGFSALMVAMGCFFLIMDFQFIEDGARANLPKYMEWYAAAGLLATLVWLYIEILRLLAKLRSSD